MYEHYVLILTPFIERKKAAAAEQQKAKKRTAPEPEPVVANRPLKGLKSTAKATVVPDEYLPPNNTLFVREIPDDYDEENLTGLFSRYPGFKEVRMVTIGRFAGSAFVEYEANEGAISAREALNGRQLSNKVLKVTYQKTG
jgi:RNA recognition motif-containing protein